MIKTKEEAVITAKAGIYNGISVFTGMAGASANW